MSLSALLVAVRTQLRSKLGLEPEQCQVRPDGRPNPSCGDLFIAVHGNSRTNEEELELGIGRNYGVACTITKRVAYLGEDTVGDEAYIKALEGIEAITDKVEGYIHKSFETMSIANNRIQNSTYKITEPLRWTDSDATPTIVRDDWFNPKSTQNQELVGLVVVVRFTNSRRQQPLTDYA